MLCNLLFSDFKDDVCFSNHDTSPVGVVFSCLLTPASIMFLKILKITIPKQRGTLVNSPSIPEFITDCQKKNIICLLSLKVYVIKNLLCQKRQIQEASQKNAKNGLVLGRFGGGKRPPPPRSFSRRVQTPETKRWLRTHSADGGLNRF